MCWRTLPAAAAKYKLMNVITTKLQHGMKERDKKRKKGRGRDGRDEIRTVCTRVEDWNGARQAHEWRTGMVHDRQTRKGKK